MKVMGTDVILCLFFYFSGNIAQLGSGKPLLSGSPVKVTIVAGEDAVLPCDLSHSIHSLHAMAVEWSRVDGDFPLTVHVMRDGEELEKEKAPEYLHRTAIMEDGSLKILNVQQWDNGTYRCFLLAESSLEQEAFVTLIVAQVSELNFSVQRTSANELFVLCNTSGWSPEPQITLGGAQGAKGPASWVEISVRPDGLYSIQALANAAAAEESGTWICKVEIPGTGVAKESTLSILDEFRPQQDGSGCDPILVVVITLLFVVVLITIVLFLPVWMMETLRVSLQLLKDSLIGLLTQKSQGHQGGEAVSPPKGDQKFSEYGDIRQVDTSGASEITARSHGLQSRGVEASDELAAKDLKEMLNYREKIRNVGNNLSIHPALIAAIISRQSEAGTKVNPSGFGKYDNNCYGLMQINRHYHAVKGGAFSTEHLDQGTTFLIQLIKTMRRTQPDWTKEQQLKGSLACYIAGEEFVIPLQYEDVDSVTPNGDFANDVIARAQWFARNGF